MWSYRTKCKDIALFMVRPTLFGAILTTTLNITNMLELLYTIYILIAFWLMSSIWEATTLIILGRTLVLNDFVSFELQVPLLVLMKWRHCWLRLVSLSWLLMWPAGSASRWFLSLRLWLQGEPFNPYRTTVTSTCTLAWCAVHQLYYLVQLHNYNMYMYMYVPYPVVRRQTIVYTCSWFYFISLQMCPPHISSQVHDICTCREKTKIVHVFMQHVYACTLHV